MLIGLRGCIVTIRTPPAEMKSYSIEGADGRIMTLTFLPDGKGLNLYGDTEGGKFEAVLYDLHSGTYGHHYIWRIWNVSQNESVLGLRIAPKNAEPVLYSYEVLNKWRMGTGDSLFPPVGQSVNTVFWFTDDSVKFSNMWLHECEPDQETINEFINLLQFENHSTQ